MAGWAIALCVLLPVIAAVVGIVAYFCFCGDNHHYAVGDEMPAKNAPDAQA